MARQHADDGHSPVPKVVIAARDRSRWLSALSWMFFCLAATGHSFAADRIILRNLDVLTDRTVVSFDEDGARLDNQAVLTWDDIERARVADDKQAEFDRLLAELGTPLYRIRQRLTVGDYRGLLPQAETLFPRYSNRRGQTAYMVCQALMWGKIAAGQREQAVEPYFCCYEILRTQPTLANQLPGPRRLKIDPQTGMTPELLPVWFDSDAAKSELPDVYAAIGRMRTPRPDAARVYFTTLAIAGGQTEQAARVLATIPDTAPATRQLKWITEAQMLAAQGKDEEAAKSLAGRLSEFSDDARPLATFRLGSVQLRSEDHQVAQDGLLHLMHIPALYGKSHPELAAAALYQAMQFFAEEGDSDGNAATRKELLEQFPQTYHAAKLRDQLTPRED